MKTRVMAHSEFAGVAGDWDALASTSYGVPILSSAFVSCCLEHFADDSVQLVVIEDDSSVVGLLFVRPDRPGALEVWHPGQAPLGFCVFDPACPLDALFEALFGHYHGRGMISVMRQDSRFVEPGRFPASADVVPYIDTPWIDCDVPFDDYWNGLGKNIKRNVRKDSNKLEARGVNPRLEIISAGGAMQAAVDAHGRLESGGWKGSENSAIAADNLQGRFYGALLEAFAGRGAAHAFQLYYGDELVASDFGISDPQGIVILKTAYLHSERETSPAQLLRHAYFPLLFEQFAGARIEFYGKTMDWHLRWTKQSRPVYHMNVYRSKLVKRVVHSVKRVAPAKAAS